MHLSDSDVLATVALVISLANLAMVAYGLWRTRNW